MRNKEIKNSERPWGKYFILDETPLYKIKRIEVDVNGRLSYQYHEKRSETWVVIHGEGIVTIDGKTKKIGKGDVLTIPKNPNTELRILVMKNSSLLKFRWVYILERMI